MAKLTSNGVTIEGTAEELAVLMAQMTTKTDEVEAEDDTLKVGDNIRTLYSDEDGDIAPGTFGKVVTTGCGTPDDKYSVKVETAAAYGSYRPQDLELVTEEQAEADAIERKKSAVFTDAGRKHNEYREGDIVTVADCEYRSNLNGKVFELVRIRGHICGGTAIFKDGGEVLADYMKPVTFVENRLDRK